MRHVAKAYENFKKNNPSVAKHVGIENVKDEKGVAPIIYFTIQSDPVKDVGINGCQARDIIEYAMHLIESFNASSPCPENVCTIAHLEEALKWQDARTKDRERREVEGKNLV